MNDACAARNDETELSTAISMDYRTYWRGAESRPDKIRGRMRQRQNSFPHSFPQKLKPATWHDFSELAAEQGSACRQTTSASVSHSQNASGKEDQTLDERKCAFYGDTQQTKWQQEQPNDWIEHKCDEGQRPTEHEENAPHQKTNHGGLQRHTPFLIKIRQESRKSSCG